MIYTQLGAAQGSQKDDRGTALQQIIHPREDPASNVPPLTRTLMEQQKAMLQSILKHFTKELTRGATMPVLDNAGRPVKYLCRLDRAMSMITMNLDESTEAKSLVFRDIERICSPEEVRNLRTANPLFIDECCTTVVLAGQRFVTFRLESVAAREYLTLCLHVLRMSQDRTRQWYT